MTRATHGEGSDATREMRGGGGRHDKGDAWQRKRHDKGDAWQRGMTRQGRRVVEGGDATRETRDTGNVTEATS